MDFSSASLYHLSMDMNLRIKEARISLGLSQQTFADKFGSTQSYISDVEKGKKMPSQDTIGIIALTFGLNLEWLETGQGEMFSAERQAELRCKIADVDYELLETILIAVEQHLEGNKRIATPSEKAELVTSFYRHFAKIDYTVDLKAVRRQIDSSISIVSSILKGE